MMIRRNYNPGPDWQDHIIIIWEQDDAPTPDKEVAPAALRRLMGIKHPRLEAKIVDEYDNGTTFLYQEGWVMRVYPEGSSIGIIYQEDAQKVCKS